MKTADISVDLIDYMGSDLSVVNAARVSFAKESEWDFNTDYQGHDTPKLLDRDVKLINYLAKHKHFSPFNHAFLSVRVKAPIFVARQLVKHKFMPWNEVSRRYVDDEPEFYFPDTFRMSAENVKQGSGEDAEEGLEKISQMYLRSSCQSAWNTYTFMLEKGICPEQARMVLPQNTMTEWIWSGSLGAFADMLHLRLDPHTQKETREVAEKIYDKGLCHFPISLEALLENK